MRCEPRRPAKSGARNKDRRGEFLARGLNDWPCCAEPDDHQSARQAALSPAVVFQPAFKPHRVPAAGAVIPRPCGSVALLRGLSGERPVRLAVGSIGNSGITSRTGQGCSGLDRTGSAGPGHVIGGRALCRGGCRCSARQSGSDHRAGEDRSQSAAEETEGSHRCQAKGTKRRRRLANLCLQLRRPSNARRRLLAGRELQPRRAIRPVPKMSRPLRVKPRSIALWFISAQWRTWRLRSRQPSINEHRRCPGTVLSRHRCAE
jgi:hypothetical protein